MPALDGVRGVAILLVLAVHALPERAAGLAQLPWTLAWLGWTGVDLFFVLSGYLITGILIETRGRPGWLRSFYARRALRIWPLYLLVLGGCVAAAWAWPDLPGADAMRRWAPWFVAHLANFALMAAGDPRALSWGTDHWWSLAIEEQVYFVWPLLVAAVAPRRLARVCLALAAGSAILRTVWVLAGGSTLAVYVLPVTHLDGLALGAALAAAGGAPALARWTRPIATRPAWLVLGYVAIAFGLRATRDRLGPDDPVALLVALPLAAVGGVTVLAAVRHHPTSALARYLAWPPLVRVGRVSYGLYHWHGLTRAFAGPLVAYPIAVLLSWASWRWWETPWLSLKRYVPRPAADAVPHTPARPEAPARAS